jgi:hypothetical protein
MVNVKVVRESSVKPPYIQLDIGLREARLITQGHKNLTDILIEDIKKASVFAEKQA